jgi:hypothetical protein
MSFSTITLYVASQCVLIVVAVYFIINSIWKLLDTLSYFLLCLNVTCSQALHSIVVATGCYFKRLMCKY